MRIASIACGCHLWRAAKGWRHHEQCFGCATRVDHRTGSMPPAAGGAEMIVPAKDARSAYGQTRRL